jgi:hypothetical protein
MDRLRKMCRSKCEQKLRACARKKLLRYVGSQSGNPQEGSIRAETVEYSRIGCLPLRTCLPSVGLTCSSATRTIRADP